MLSRQQQLLTDRQTDKPAGTAVTQIQTDKPLGTGVHRYLQTDRQTNGHSDHTDIKTD